MNTKGHSVQILGPEELHFGRDHAGHMTFITRPLRGPSALCLVEEATHLRAATVSFNPPKGQIGSWIG